MLGRLFKKILAVLKKLFKWLGPLIIIIAILIVIFAPYLIPVIMGWLSTAWAAISGFAVTVWTTISGWISAAWGVLSSVAGDLWTAGEKWLAEASWGEVLKLAAGAAVILNPEGAADALGSVVDTVGDFVAKVAGPLLPWIVGGALLWFLFKGDNDEPNGSVVIQTRGDGEESPRRSDYS